MEGEHRGLLANVLNELRVGAVQEMIGKGRYGTVCKGSLNDRTVAVKIFAQHHHLYYANEKDIYKLFRMDYPFLPRLIGKWGIVPEI